VLIYQNITRQIILNLIGQSDDPVTLKGEAIDETVLIPQLKATNNKSVLAGFFIAKMAAPR